MKIETRADIFNKTRADFEMQGYTATERVISILKVNIMAFVTAAPIGLLFWIVYANIHPYSKFDDSLRNSTIVLVAFIMCIFVHELLHGIGWCIFCKDKKSISFGFMWQTITPYCTCAEPLKFGKYLFGGLLPVLVLGVGLFLISLVAASKLLLVISIYNVIAAGGDLTIGVMLIKHRKAIIVDHPTKCGFVAFYK